MSIQNNFTNSFTPPPLRIKCSYSESGLVFFSTFIHGILKRNYHTMHNHSNLSDCSPPPWTIGVSKWFFGNELENECPVYSRCRKLNTGNPHCLMAMRILSILKSKI